MTKSHANLPLPLWSQEEQFPWRGRGWLGRRGIRRRDDVIIRAHGGSLEKPAEAGVDVWKIQMAAQNRVASAESGMPHNIFGDICCLAIYLEIETFDWLHCE